MRGNDGVELRVAAIARVGGRAARCIVNIVRRDECHQLANHREAFGVIVREKMRDSRGLVMRGAAAELVFRDFFMRDRLDHIGTGDKHIGGLIDHEDEICNGR